MTIGRGRPAVWLRRTAATGAAVVAVLGGLVAPASADSPRGAAGAYGCAGNEINTYPVRTTAGALYGVIHLYYDAASGENCAVNVKTTAGGSGSPSWTSITLRRCTTSTPGAFCETDDMTSDSGDYSLYAGPVSIRAQGQCVRVAGQVSADPPVATGGSGTGGVHCG